MNRIEFDKITTTKSLSAYLNCPEERFLELISKKEEKKLYSSFRLLKKKFWNRSLELAVILEHKGLERLDPKFFRVIFVVVDKQYGDLLKNISENLGNIYADPDNCVQAFVRGRGIKTNAEQHLSKKIILNLDIKDFFDSITIEKVKEAFSRLGCNQEISDCLSNLCTVDGRLVQGFCTSPVLSNMVCSDIDLQLTKLANRSNCTYTRYSDDITFSTNEALPEIEEIKKILSDNGFILNNDKTKIQRKGYCQYVTGLTVSDDKIPRISKRYKRRLRLELYYIKKFGFTNHMNKSKNFNLRWNGLSLKGKIAFVNSVEPQLGKKLFKILGEIIDNC